MIQPGSDAVHGLAEGASRRFFDTHDEWGIECHIAVPYKGP
jgi:hypothetical protein